jgi:hypothetical protein
MKRITITFIILLVSHLGNTQPSLYSENFWGSILWRNSWKNKVLVSSDIGYRYFDAFFSRTRQQLVRISVDNFFKENHSLGFGYASFNSYSSSLKTLTRESRPFIQYKWNKKNITSNFGIRIRNEFRYFLSSKEFKNRFRSQFYYERKTNSKLVQPRLFLEEFLTTNSNPFMEQRYGFGNTFKLHSSLNLFLFYTLQLQETIKLNNKQVKQHIIGVQFQINTNTNEN